MAQPGKAGVGDVVWAVLVRMEARMTNSELAELCNGHEGKPWFPKELGFVKACGEFALAGSSLTADEAESLIIGSVMKWLLSREHDISMYRSGDVHRVITFCDRVSRSHTASRGSLVAACIAAAVAVESEA
jgi:hypothetical protein